MNDMNDLNCREARQALGVYVVGAIDPAERSVLEAHLSHCPECREELAGLAGLPALLGRVPRLDAERMALDAGELPASEEPPDELLSSLLGRVAARRKARRWRGLFATAAALIIAVGGGAAISRELAPGSPAPETVAATSPVTHATAVVDYSPSARGTAIWVKVGHIPSGTTCDFWVVNAAGKRIPAGSWTVWGSYGSHHWYPASVPLPVAQVHGFALTTSTGRLLVRIPA